MTICCETRRSGISSIPVQQSGIEYQDREDQAAASGVISGVAYEAGLGAHTVKGFGDSTTPFAYTLSGGLNSASAAEASISGMDDPDGAWAVLTGTPSFTSNSIRLHGCEDQMTESEQIHTDEQVGYIVFE